MFCSIFLFQNYTIQQEKKRTTRPKRPAERPTDRATRRLPSPAEYDNPLRRLEVLVVAIPHGHPHVRHVRAGPAKGDLGYGQCAAPRGTTTPATAAYPARSPFRARCGSGSRGGLSNGRYKCRLAPARGRDGVTDGGGGGGDDEDPRRRRHRRWRRARRYPAEPSLAAADAEEWRPPRRCWGFSMLWNRRRGELGGGGGRGYYS